MSFIKLSPCEGGTVFLAIEHIISIDRGGADGHSATAVTVPGKVHLVKETPRALLAILGQASVHAWDRHGRLHPEVGQRARPAHLPCFTGRGRKKPDPDWAPKEWMDEKCGLCSKRFTCTGREEH